MDPGSSPPAEIKTHPETDYTYAFVDLNYRRENLIKALQYFGLSSQKEGMSTAVNSPNRRGSIISRYGRNAERIVEGAKNNAEKLMIEAESELIKATGILAIMDSGLIKEPEAKSLAKAFFKDFKEKYAGPVNRKARDQKKAQLSSKRRYRLPKEEAKDTSA